MNVALQQEVMVLPEGERKELTRRLKRMGSYELDRENNLARNRALTAGLGLGSTAAFVGMKKKQTEEEEDARKAKQAKRGEEEEWSGSGSESGTDTEGETQPQKKRAVATRARGGGKAGKGDKDAVAEWARKAKKMLLEGGPGTKWEGIVEAWWALEELTQFVSKTKSHATTSRPREVGVWVKNARKGTPKVVAESFGKSSPAFQAWDAL
ncbi:hypothetical protein B0H16DRAFT_1731618 [Mycena metata]|uniref:Uncharacterized protein n=1 Tax=Mycena metata TaxID=1033252 RepID=A0AAD7MWA0_9AGAR|nr:hypothetical protein B0H16DRAFT_1731618 [Mycena metata]